MAKIGVRFQGELEMQFQLRVKDVCLMGINHQTMNLEKNWFSLERGTFSFKDIENSQKQVECTSRDHHLQLRYFISPKIRVSVWV